MKNTIITIVIFIAFLIIYFLQANFFSWFTIAGVKPNLFIILALFLGLFAGRNMGVGFGIFIGLALDMFIGKKIGISSIMYGAVGYLGGHLGKNFSKESKITIMLMVITSTIVYEVGTYIISILSYAIYIDIISFIKILMLEVIFNSFITIIIYPLIQKSGYYIENNFKENKILTRYF